MVVSGRGEFVNGSERHAFAPGDLLFVPAGVEHRFEQFSDDLAVWVVFLRTRRRLRLLRYCNIRG